MKDVFKNRPVRQKVIVVLFLAILSTLMLNAVGMFILQRISFFDRAESRMRESSELISVAINASFFFGDAEETTEILGRLMRNSDITHISIMGYPSGEIFAQVPEQLSVPSEVKSGGMRITETSDGYWYKGELQDNKGNTYAFVFILSSLTNLQEEQSRILLLLLTVFLVLLVIGFAAASFLRRALTEPVSLLAGVVKQVAETGDKSLRAKKFADDEIGYLADNINSMLQSLSDQSVEIQQSEAAYRTLFEESPNLIYLATSDGYIVDINKKVMHYGLRKEELIGKNIKELGWTNEEIHGNYYAMLKSKGKIDGMETRYYNAVGTIFDLISYASIVNYKGRPHILAIVADITDQKLSDRKLREQSEQFRLLFDSASDSILIIKENAVVACNKSAMSMFKGDQNVITGTKVEQLLMNTFTIDHYDLSIFKMKASAAASGKPQVFDVSFLYRDFEEIEIEVSMKAFSMANGLHLQIIFRDITARKVVHRELENSRKNIEGVVNSIPNAIIAIDSQNCFRMMNKSAQDFKTFHGDGVGLPLFEVFGELAFLRNLIEESPLDTLTQRKSIMTSLKNGEVGFYDVSMIPSSVYGKGSRIIIIEDVSDKRKMEQLMIDSEKMMTIAGLAAGMAHEINNPLGTISQGCQNVIRRTTLNIRKNLEAADSVGVDFALIKSYLEKREIYSILDSVVNAVGKASEIIKGMLHFSRRGESQKVKYSIEKVIDESIELTYSDYHLKKKIDLKSVRFIKDIDPDLPDIPVIVTELQQVFFNLFQNAAHAMLSDEHRGSKIPQVTIRARREDDLIRIDIIDNGPGIDEKTRSRIFEPFFTTKKFGEGTGLGLSVSYMIITNKHQGEMAVESIPGEGAAFQIKLPVSAL